MDLHICTVVYTPRIHEDTRGYTCGLDTRGYMRVHRGYTDIHMLYMDTLKYAISALTIPKARRARRRHVFRLSKVLFEGAIKGTQERTRERSIG